MPKVTIDDITVEVPEGINVVDAAKLRSLGWAPRFSSFEQGWREVLRWYQAERWVPRYA